ncbi:MAG: HAMP domain-containing histidine kinase [Saprospiraceae bacterium]|nr:HAMP domain-containing histidine kinase [Saprospiraceae bacterium]
MDIYSRKSRWKWYLAIAGIIIVLISVFYTNYLTGKLANEERKKVQHWLMALESVSRPVSDDCLDCGDFTLQTEILKANTTIPVILVSETGTIVDAFNFGPNRDTNTVFLNQEIERLKTAGIEPVEGFAQKVYFKQSSLLTMLQYFPLIQLILISAFILSGYLAFSTARRSEQNQVWVGMAKETAHQLGTPISAIIGWIEHLKSIRAEDEEIQEIVSELSNDVLRLDLIADRFSKIGSTPELKRIDVYEELEKCRAYMEIRAPRKVNFHFPEVGIHAPLYIEINPPLFDWVVENLLRNALDAMEGSGDIIAEVSEENNQVIIDITDTGKGIPSGRFKTVFRPGFTTKKRGWGLGLSLAKRIIESYHTGKIFVKRSEPNVATTFSIELKKV